MKKRFNRVMGASLGSLILGLGLISCGSSESRPGPRIQEAVVLVSPTEIYPAYAGEVQGVVLANNPALKILDVKIPVDSSLIHRAFSLDHVVRRYPPGTVFLIFGASVPGREGLAVAVKTKAGHILVGPDSGVFTRVLEREEVDSYCHIKASGRVQKEALNSMFPERDVYAPVAAALAGGEALDRLGAPGASLVKIPLPRAANAGSALNGEILYTTWTGRLVTNFPKSAFGIVKEGQLLRFHAQGKTFNVVYLSDEQEAPPGRPFGVCNEDGFFEIAILDANAAQALKLVPGQKLSIR